MTPKVLKDLYTGAAEKTDNIYVSGAAGSPVTLAFTGDICLADDWENMAVYKKSGISLSGCITGGLLDIMNAADLMYINNEFTFSDRGEPLENKYYTFRASPANVILLSEMGVDVVSLANNHVYDYGSLAFADTLETLDKTGIPYIGAGFDIVDASKPRYFIVNGIKIAFVAASRAEKYIMTPEAKENSGGILRTYDPRRFIAVIAEAKANADYVIACPHWGTENSAVLEEAQTTQARQYIDAGADAVVGSHTHCLQGIEFYKDCPIMYSLGNFWFNHEKGDTALLEIKIDGGILSLSLVPCLQDGGITSSAAGTDEGERILKYIESISASVTIDEAGRVTAAE
jgi:poly-gamma-glutamate synthesis protein (capsule biosynthesis protein)